MNFRYQLSLFSLVFLTLLSCSDQKEPLKSGIWSAEIATSIGSLPFELEIDENLNVFALNGEERLKLDTAYYRNDSLVIDMQVFEGIIIASVQGDVMKGTFSKKMADLTSRTTSFQATFGKKEKKFLGEANSTKIDITGKYEVLFTEDAENSYPAIGIFEQKGENIQGTFLTETGDYRYLSGNVVKDSLLLSCFDGTHVFLFKAKVVGDSLTGGKFSASLTYEETWKGFKNENAKLKDASELTFLKDGYDGISFEFKNTKGEVFKFPSDAHKGKVVILQVLGSWCPNCMDETKFLSKWLNENPNKDIEIIGLAFEKSMDPTYAYPKIDQMKKRFGVPYDVLLAGLNDKEEALKSLPMLNAIISFPTAIFIDKKGKVRHIHTGFSGPGTGVYYTKFVDDFNRLTDMLLAE